MSVRRPPPYALPFAESDLHPRVRNRERERERERERVLKLERKKFRENVKIEKWKKRP
jgi:predicted rRNA methylase YqxC with S4 and FtsJ domains